jgi:hypothetical protein
MEASAFSVKVSLGLSDFAFISTWHHNITNEWNFFWVCCLKEGRWELPKNAVLGLGVGSNPGPLALELRVPLHMLFKWIPNELLKPFYDVQVALKHWEIHPIKKLPLTIEYSNEYKTLFFDLKIKL